MKNLNLLILLIGTSVFLFCCSEDDPDSKVTRFTGEELFVEMHDGGTWTPQPSGLLLGEGSVFEYYDSASDPRVTGTLMAYVDALFDTTFSGQWWGTGELTVDNGGSWDLMLMGDRSVTEGSSGEGIGHGKGVLEGLTAQWTYKRLPEEVDYTIEGFIVEP